MSDAVLEFPQVVGMRRRDRQGRRLHACCMCSQLEPWTTGWRWYGSDLEIDEGKAVMKFCPKHKGDDLHLAVTTVMAEEARQREYITA